MITHGRKQISEMVYARKASEGGGAVRLTNMIRGGAVVFGGLFPKVTWLYPPTRAAIVGAFGQTDGKAVIKATNAYLNGIAATDPTKAQALAEVLNSSTTIAVNWGHLFYDYQLVDYVQSTGTQWIDTSMRLRLDTEFEIEFSIESNSEIFGWGSSNHKEACYVAGDSINYSDDWNSSVEISANDGNFHTVKVRNGEQYCDGNLVGNLRLTTIINNITLVEFGYRTQWKGVEASACKIRRVSIKDATKEIYHFSAYNKTSGTIGMFDIINGEFYTNAGSGTFLKGPDVTPYTP